MLFSFQNKIKAENILDCSNNNCNYEAALLNDSEYIYYETLEESINAVQNATETTIYLVNDVSLSNTITIVNGKNIIIDGQNKFKIVRNNGFTGGFIKISSPNSEQKSTLEIKDAHIDAGAKFKINNSKFEEIESSNPKVATSSVATDYYILEENSLTSTETLITVDSSSNLILNNTNLQNFISSNSNIFSISNNSILTLKGNSSIKNNLITDGAMLGIVSGIFKLEDNSSIKNNTIISNGGVSLLDLNNGEFYINNQSEISHNTIINSSYMILIKNDAKVIINDDNNINGAKITYNKSYPGPNSTLSTIFYNYNTNTGTFIMKSGEISNNIGGKYVVMDQRRPLDILNFENGIIKNNKSVYENGIGISMRASDIGEKMIIDDSIYIRLGGTDDSHYFNNYGTLNGNILISQLNGTFKNEGIINSDITINNSYGGQTILTGVINGNLTINNKANVLLTGQINGDVYIDENSSIEINGTINGNLFNNISTSIENTISGTGKLNGTLIVKHNLENKPEITLPSIIKDEKVIYHNFEKDVLVEFIIKDEKKENYNSYMYSFPKNSYVDPSDYAFDVNGYISKSWYLEKELINLWKGNIESNNIKLYADWEKLQVPETYDKTFTIFSVFLITALLLYSILKKSYILYKI